jgi:DNA-binding response OmpR family regulator
MGVIASPILSKPASPVAALRPRRVLVAENNDRVRMQLASALDTAGYAVESVATAQAAVQAVLGSAMHLVALDLDLPDMDPQAVIDGMRRVCSVPPIVLLATHGADPRGGPLRQSAAACIFKPVDNAHFVGTCRRVLRLSESRVRWESRTEPRRLVRIPVTVEAAGRPPERAILVNLSLSGFQIELAGPTLLGRHLRVVLSIPGSSHTLTFEGRLDWQKPIPTGTLAGGGLLTVGAEDERILEALLHPLN